MQRTEVEQQLWLVVFSLGFRECLDVPLKYLTTLEQVIHFLESKEVHTPEISRILANWELIRKWHAAHYRVINLNRP